MISDKERQRIIQICQNRQEFVQEVDGFVYWWPEGSSDGYLSSYVLRLIADELDKRNKPLEEDIEKYFNNLKNK